MNRVLLKLAIPCIISNITVPLLGMVDMAIAGHLDSPTYIGAIALGSTIFTLIYWNFSFLRMGTGGFVAQAYGERRMDKSANILLHAGSIALAISLIILLISPIIETVALNIIEGNEEMKQSLSSYFRIRIWGAPAVMLMYVYNGWFVGMQNTKIPMLTAIVANISNIVLSCIFVFFFNMEIEGIALGTMLSQYIGLALSTILWNRYYSRILKYLDVREAFKASLFRSLFKVNRDVFIRTLCLVSVTSFFTFTSSTMGATTLAVNALLMQFFTLFSYFMDSLAYAGEALTGKFIGAKNYSSLRVLLRKIFLWGGVISICAAIVYAIFSSTILSILTNQNDLIVTAHQYSLWIIILPVVSFAAFLWDGVFVGAMSSESMRNSMFISAILFFITYYSLNGQFENNALWAAFILFLGSRSLVQTLQAKRIFRFISKEQAFGLSK